MKLAIEPLTREAFARFGDVIEMEGAHHYPINQGFAERFHDLARIDTSAQGGETILSLFRGKPRALPIKIDFVERHPLGSQAFYPLQDRPWLIVVAEATHKPTARRCARSAPAAGKASTMRAICGTIRCWSSMPTATS